MKLFTAILCIAAAASTAQAAISINVIGRDTDSGFFLNESGGSLDANYTLSFGIFDRATYNSLPPEQQTNFDVTSALLSTNSEQTLTFSSDGTILNAQPPANQYNLPIAGGGTTGDVLYVLVYNTLNTNEWGLFTSVIPTWVLPSDGLGSSTLSPITATEALVGTVSGNNVLLSNTVPEPSTYALLAGVMTLGLVAYRRRQKA